MIMCVRRNLLRWTFGAVLLSGCLITPIRGEMRDEVAGHPFPVRELGISRSLPAAVAWPPEVVSPVWGDLAREFGATWVHRGRRDGVAFLLYRCPGGGRASGLAKLIRGEALGNTVLSFASEATEEKRASVAAFVRAKLEAWQATLPSEEVENERPVVLRQLPAQALQPGTEYYAVGARGLAQAAWLRAGVLPTPPGSAFAWADYTDKSPFAHFLIAEYPTPQDATAALDAAQLLTSDRCLVARRGNFIVVADGIRDIIGARTAIERVKYDYVVRWLSTPPPHSSTSARTTQQDIRHIGQLLISIASFVVLAGVGMVTLGAAVGGVFFYWRRQRAGDGFIAADTMLRLNLTEERTLPAPRESSAKRLTD